MFGQMKSSRRSGPSCSRGSGCPCECHPLPRTPEQREKIAAPLKKELRIISLALMVCVAMLATVIIHSVLHPSPPPCFRTIYVRDLQKDCRLGRSCSSTGGCGPDYVYCDFTGPANGGTHCEKNR
jgi:hypothetical protein